MALFGDLEHHALTDLARILGTRSGTLYFHSAYRGRTLELTVVQGHLRALYLDGFPVRETGQVHDILGELRAQGRGAFEFKPREFSATTPGFYNLPLLDLLPALTGAPLPEDQLPHPDTRFVPTTPPARVPPTLADTWALVGPHLASGASASDLARRVGRTEREVRETLHRLRAVNLIAPQRAGSVTRPGVPVAAQPAGDGPAGGSWTPVAPPAPAPLVHRLLGALRRLTGAVSA
ncbi:hypothetical protein [Deinococcus aestuarii]|uniref:hypothetical protein n=1 Tax=Deinococcus aestuarii TaxID=2774531 RepID=UPI001C0A9DCD|nr:hypothetical protein [Deinococcus aestuarii]